MNSKNPKIEWQKKENVDCLRFTFKGELTEKDAEVAVKEWRETFQSKPDTPIVVIWDCLKLNGYESGARNKWTEAIKEMKPQIARIWLITESNLIKMGASVIRLATSLNIKVIKSENEIII